MGSQAARVRGTLRLMRADGGSEGFSQVASDFVMAHLASQRGLGDVSKAMMGPLVCPWLFFFLPHSLWFRSGAFEALPAEQGWDLSI